MPRSRREPLTFLSGDVRLEGVLGRPAGIRHAPGVVICHPHPQMGGSMENNVVYGLFDEFVERGFLALAFNFRGTGRSGGRHDGGPGEIRDVLAALHALESRPEHDGSGLGLLGYSFGAWIVLQAAREAPDRVRCTGAVAPPVEMLPFDFLADVPGELFFVWGDQDPFCPAGRAQQLLATRTSGCETRQLAGADHFLLGREREAAAFLCDGFTRRLANPDPGSGS